MGGNPEELAGVQLTHFATFSIRSCRVPDWPWRAAWLLELLSPERLGGRQRVRGSAAVAMLGVGPGGDPSGRLS